MIQYIMKGGNPLVGEVVVGGAKNAALGILCLLYTSSAEGISGCGADGYLHAGDGRDPPG